MMNIIIESEYYQVIGKMNNNYNYHHMIDSGHKKKDDFKRYNALLLICRKNNDGRTR